MNDENEVCTSRGSTLVYSIVECCVFAVCLSSKSRSVFGWHDCYLTYVRIHVCTLFICYFYSISTNIGICTYFTYSWYSIKWCVV